MHFNLGRLEEALASFEENSRSNVTDERYRSLNNMGAIAGLRGDLAESYARLEEALTLARESGNVDDVAGCLNNLAATAERMAAYPREIERFREARDLAKRTGNSRNAVQHLLNLAEVYGRPGSLGPAWNTAQEALTEGEELGYLRIQGQALEQLGQISRYAGLLELAREYFEQARDKFARLGDERTLSRVDSNVALTEFQLGTGSYESVGRHIERLYSLGLNENVHWFWLELALAAPEVALGRQWLERAQEGRHNRHRRVVLEIARLRIALLGGEEVADHARVLRPALEELEMVEAPMGHILLWIGLRPRQEAGHHWDRARQLVDEQGRGLPRKLRDSLAGQPERWRQSLGF